MEVFDEAARRVREDLDLLGYGIEVFGPIHRDLTLGNLLFGARTGPVGVTDFDQCGLGHHLFDLSVVLRSLLRSWRRAGRPEGTLERALEALVGGYADLRGLPPDHERLLRAFDVMQRTAAVNRTLRLRSSETTRGRSCRDAFLRQFVVWLERGYLA